VTTNWDGYEIYRPLVAGRPNDMARADARAEYDYIMASRTERHAQLQQLFQNNGVVCGETDVAVQGINDWFVASVEADPDHAGRLKTEWYSVAMDLGLFLGDIIVNSVPGLHWQLFAGGKRDASYQHHVVMGFNSPNPKYKVDLEAAVVGTAHRIVVGLEVESDRFVRILRAVRDRGALRVNDS
jgi:hypothetical protein